MKRKHWVMILAVEICVLLGILGLLARFRSGPALSLPSEPPTETTQAPATAPPTTAAPTTEPTTVPPTTEPEPEVFRLSFAGDCTLGTLYDLYEIPSCFPAVVGEDYGYPFRNVQDWFGTDDFTMVNLEGPLTEDGTPADKTFVFRGDPKLANCLTAGSVEYVSLANNHSEDFGWVGYENTQDALDAVGISYGGDGESRLFVTDRGLKIGVFTIAFYVSPEYMARELASLQEQGAELLIASFHWGIEGDYHHSWDQEALAHAAIDAGADIVFGHHPHVLQEIEQYGDGIIFYSMGNFSFGGNSDPADYDTAVISQEVIREPDGTVRLGTTEVVPCSISSDCPNNYQPTPAEPGSERYDRVLEKLNLSGPILENRQEAGQ